ncbi:ATP-binding cassette domain-containing protein [Spiribacter aquaticus]|uniref:ATP-binding cassette domain-containing protein n=1 Tax=Spiribacter aquaticus TaxID=1935996 RepID=A0A557RKG4_9GAMM|nr:ATP-binding cassette domain-containing protein [Spiribacter aquaticus]
MPTSRSRRTRRSTTRSARPTTPPASRSANNRQLLVGAVPGRPGPVHTRSPRHRWGDRSLLCRHACMSDHENPVSVDSLHVRYGRLEVLKGVTFDIHNAQGVVLLGANGSGKSTLMRTLNGLARPQSGEIRVNGESVTQARRPQLRVQPRPAAHGFSERADGRSWPAPVRTDQLRQRVCLQQRPRSGHGLSRTGGTGGPRRQSPDTTLRRSATTRRDRPNAHAVADGRHRRRTHRQS